MRRVTMKMEAQFNKIYKKVKDKEPEKSLVQLLQEQNNKDIKDKNTDEKTKDLLKIELITSKFLTEKKMRMNLRNKFLLKSF